MSAADPPSSVHRAAYSTAVPTAAAAAANSSLGTLERFAVIAAIRSSIFMFVMRTHLNALLCFTAHRSLTGPRCCCCPAEVPHPFRPSPNLACARVNISYYKRNYLQYLPHWPGRRTRIRKVSKALIIFVPLADHSPSPAGSRVSFLWVFILEQLFFLYVSQARYTLQAEVVVASRYNLR